ncbi:hypothetical protein CQW23_18948 [Capsicum baccatum]|uniref:GED domain-containing protein n=1 Tax=Capsicum baccatum TaxID=33114 RepID=A0A2G2W4E2_CAPBA|nr:hypothetical protein CQW23_18948 [Capsicum baccatum]
MGLAELKSPSSDQMIKIMNQIFSHSVSWLKPCPTDVFDLVQVILLHRQLLFDGVSTTRTWGVTSLFGIRGSSVGNSSKRHAAEVINDIDQAPPVIQLKNPPSVLRPGEAETEYQVEIIVTKLLITSYYDIVRRNIQDLVPKAIMHYLVNHAKRNLLGTFIEKLYRENLFEDLLQEQDDVVTQRRATAEMCHALRQAVETLDEFVADVSTLSSSDSMDALPKRSYLSSNSYSKSSA